MIAKGPEKIRTSGKEKPDQQGDNGRAKYDWAGSDEKIANVIVYAALAAVFDVSQSIATRFVPFRFEWYELVDLVAEEQTENRMPCLVNRRSKPTCREDHSFETEYSHQHLVAHFLEECNQKTNR